MAVCLWSANGEKTTIHLDIANIWQRFHSQSIRFGVFSSWAKPAPRGRSGLCGYSSCCYSDRDTPVVDWTGLRGVKHPACAGPPSAAGTALPLRGTSTGKGGSRQLRGWFISWGDLIGSKCQTFSQTFFFGFWGKQMALHRVGGPHPRSWRPHKTKTDMPDKRGFCQETAFGPKMELLSLHFA